MTLGQCSQQGGTWLVAAGTAAPCLMMRKYWNVDLGAAGHCAQEAQPRSVEGTWPSQNSCLMQTTLLARRGACQPGEPAPSDPALPLPSDS